MISMEKEERTRELLREKRREPTLSNGSSSILGTRPTKEKEEENAERVCVCVYTNTGLVKKCKRNKILKRSERRRDSSGGRDAKAFVVYCSNMPFTLTIPFSHKFKSLRNLSISSASPSTMTSVVTSLSTIFTFTFSFRPALSK